MNHKDFKRDEKLAGWSFTVEETCRGVWEATGEDRSGSTVSRTGTTDPQIILEECISNVRALEFERNSKS